MKTGLEQALAECLASVESGSSIEDCLSRYPALAEQLEPLLLTALGLQQVYDVRARPSFRRAARERFLAAAAQRGRQPLAVAPPRRFAFGWRWVPAAVGAAALVAVIALATVLALSGGGGGARTGPGRVIVERITPASTQSPGAVVSDIPRLLEQAQARLGEMQQQVQQGAVIPRQAIQELRDINASLEQSLSSAPPEAAEAAPQIADLLAQQQEVLDTAREQDQVAPEAADDVDDLISIAEAVQKSIDEMLSPTPTSTPEPSQTPTPTTAPPTETPTASPTATDTPTASPTGTPAATSSPTPEPTPAADASPTPASP